MFTKPTPVVRQIMITWCLIVYPKIRHHGHIPNSCFVLQLILFTAKLSNIFNVRRDISVTATGLSLCYAQTMASPKCQNRRYNRVGVYISLYYYRGRHVMIVWQLDLQLPMQSLPITINLVNSNPANGKRYFIQH